jgi:hypothetical protein
MRRFIISTLFMIAAVPITSAQSGSGNRITVKGWVADSACAYTKGLTRPISIDCAKSCANNGSPLVLLGDDGTIFLPIDGKTPSASQNPKLLPYAGKRVSIRGIDYVRNGSHALVIESITAFDRR